MCTDLHDFWYATLQMNTNHTGKLFTVLLVILQLRLSGVFYSFYWYLGYVNLFDINMRKELMMREMCYFCVLRHLHSSTVATILMCNRKFLHQVLWYSFAKLCTKNYKNPSIFVKVTAKKSVAPFSCGQCVAFN